MVGAKSAPACPDGHGWGSSPADRVTAIVDVFAALKRDDMRVCHSIKSLRPNHRFHDPMPNVIVRRAPGEALDDQPLARFDATVATVGDPTERGGRSHSASGREIDGSAGAI